MTEPRSVLKPLLEVLCDAREGAPRLVAIEARHDTDANDVVRCASVEADARGFVPLVVDDYLRVRELRPEELRERTLLLIAPPGTNASLGRCAFVQAASQSPRPHILLTLRSDSRGSDRVSVVREARPVYGLPNAVALPGDVARHLERASRSGALAAAGCHAAAERLLRDVAGALTRRKAWPQASAVVTRLGCLLLERGRAADAVSAFGDAAAHADVAGDETAALAARVWQAAARTDAGQLVAAEAQCRAVLAVGMLTGDEHLRARATLARSLLWQERADEAVELEADSDHSVFGAPPYVISTRIRIWLEGGDLFEAGQQARAFLIGHDDDPLTRVMALTAHLRVLVTTGDLALAADRLVELRQAAREARTPLRLARARLIYADALRRAGRTVELARELKWLGRVRKSAPPLLRGAIDRRLRGERCDGAPGISRAGRPLAAPALVAMAREDDDDRSAVARVVKATGDALRSSRIDVNSADAGPVSLILSAGAGMATALGARVLEAGFTIGPEAHENGWELAVPVRIGSTMLAALAARWPHDRQPAAHARELLELAAAVSAPRVEAMLAARRDESAASLEVPELVGGSAAMIEVRKAVAKAAAAPFNVLIEGESGVGKELLARAVHQLGPRRERRFRDVNCAALPDDLLESELFGHARGAFTGAVTDRAGLFEDADGGTLFLDEVADLSPRAQAKLLRAVQQQEVRRVGETFSRKIDVRLVAAANRDLRTEAAEGRFRQDLLYRLDVIRIRIPPLRERPDDVAPLAAHFWRTASSRVATTAVLTHGVLSALARYHWPGNVRELQNVIAALAVAAPARGAVRPSLLPAAITGAAAIRSARLSEARMQFERRFVEVALARAGGSRARAARELGVSRQGLLKILARVGIT